MNLLISACLLGSQCRYDGKGVLIPEAEALLKEHHLIPVCPELLGGLGIPRVPAERRGDRVITREGQDVTAEYERGAREALRLARVFHCRAAILKERSPSCGCGRIYDGSFQGRLTQGDGVCAALLKNEGIQVSGESEIADFLRRL